MDGRDAEDEVGVFSEAGAIIGDYDVVGLCSDSCLTVVERLHVCASKVEREIRLS